MLLIRRRAAVTATPTNPPRPAVVRRVRPGQAAAPQVAAAPAGPARVLRLTNTTNAAVRQQAQNAAKIAINDHLQSIAKLEAQLDELMAHISEEHGTIEKLMRDNNISYHSNGVYETEIAETYTRQDRKIDPKKFKNAVADKDFWACVNIPVGAAKKVMSEKELGMISDVVPPTLVGYIFKIRKRERKSK